MPVKHVLKTPYPWFGGKKMVAEVVWERFGDVANYVEPFFGGGAMLLNRPGWHTGRTETVNDINAWLTNFWRAVKTDPDAVAYHASDPVNELDLHSRGDWLFYRRDYADFVEAMRSDPEYYDVKSAGWWVWGQCAWIGTGWGRMEARSTETVNRKRSHLGDAGRGVNRKLPHLGNVGGVAE